MQKVVTDRLRPEGKSDPHGVEQAMSLMRTALGLLDAKIGSNTWAMGKRLHDGRLRGRSPIILCQPGDAAGRVHKQTAAYLHRLMDRPSFARVIEEAKPYRHFFPIKGADWSFA